MMSYAVVEEFQVVCPMRARVALSAQRRDAGTISLMP